jgi:hypothetical protein
MSYEEALSKQAVAISISESSDMSVLGLSEEHLVDAMAEVARHLLAMGARLLYGGDLRAGGFTEVLFELIARYRRDADLGDERVGVTNFLAWPVHVSLAPDRVKELSDSFRGVAELLYLTMGGRVMSADDRARLVPRAAADDEWADGLTSMREVMTEMSNARVVLGGKTDGFKGRMPGIAEEVLSTLRVGKPLFLLGGFGGCAGDIANTMGLTTSSPTTSARWPGRDEFGNIAAEALNNGLDSDENAKLATTIHADEAVTLILRGLLRRK